MSVPLIALLILVALVVFSVAAGHYFCSIIIYPKVIQVSPVRDIASVTTPVMPAHGRQDDYVLPAMSRALCAPSPAPVLESATALAYG
jgi:hypothetical protein